MPEPRRNTIRTSQPGKAVWTIFTLAFNAARLPLWLLYYIPQGTRPHAKWSWRQAVRMRIVKAFLAWASQVEVKTPLSLKPGAEKDQWVTINPANSKYYTGITTKDSEIKPAEIGGTWYPSVPSAKDKPSSVCIHFHGGAYAIGDGRKADAGFAAATLIKHGEIPYVFCPQYRLASNPGGRFPAALQDAITAYAYLVFTMGFDPSTIVIGGDSAGGNLTMALLRYFADHGKELGLGNPKAALLWSPWVDPPSSMHKPELLASSPNQATDYLNAMFPTWGMECYAPSAVSGIPANSPYITFIDTAFKTETPLYVSTGECEVLLHDDVKFYEQFRKVPGNVVELQVEEYAPHDIILVGPLNSFAAEAERGVRRAAKWLKTL